MIDMIAPWYVSYFATWLDYAREKPDDVCVLHYSDFVTDPAHVLEAALDHADLSRSRFVCQAALDAAWKDRGALRFNKGSAGRGKDYFSPGAPGASCAHADLSSCFGTLSRRAAVKFRRRLPMMRPQNQADMQSI